MEEARSAAVATADSVLTWGNTTACTAAPTAASVTYDSTGRPWGYENGKSCAFRDVNGAARLRGLPPSPRPLRDLGSAAPLTPCPAAAAAATAAYAGNAIYPPEEAKANATATATAEASSATVRACPPLARRQLSPRCQLSLTH